MPDTPRSSSSSDFSFYPPRMQVLQKWYAENARFLPWRKEGTPAWAVLVCEIMSQQTPVQRVIPAWLAWMKRWPTPFDLASASPAEVIHAWGRLGYPRRALYLRDCAITLVKEYNGQLPRERESLLALPGIGPYTADAILTFAYRERTCVLDTNIRRVLYRHSGIAHAPAHLSARERAKAQALVPASREDAITWNSALMELGALVCTSRPQCGICPLSSTCRWFGEGKPENAKPGRTQKYEGTHRQARGAILRVLRERFARWHSASPHSQDQENTLGISEEELEKSSGLDHGRFRAAFLSLLEEEMIEGREDSRGNLTYRLPHD